MSESDYAQWIALYVGVSGATGTGEDRLTEILAANRHVFDKLGATYAELCECSDRLVEKGAVPNWPNEHTNALIRELNEIRAVRDRAKYRADFPRRYSVNGHVQNCDCPSCNGGEMLESYQAARDRLATYVKESQPKKKRKRS